MVDAQTVEDAAFQKPEHKLVRVVEHLRQLHAQAGEIVDVEEAAIVDVVGGDAEMRGAPVLLLDQRVEAAPAVEAAGLAIEPRDRGRNRVAAHRPVRGRARRVLP